MALVKNVGTTKVSLGSLSADTVFTCYKGTVGLTTDDAADDDTAGVRDYYTLSAGQRLVIASGNTVKYTKLAGPECEFHHMPV